MQVVLRMGSLVTLLYGRKYLGGGVGMSIYESNILVAYLFIAPLLALRITLQFLLPTHVQCIV